MPEDAADDLSSGEDDELRELVERALRQSTPQQIEALNSFLLKYFASEVQSIKGLNPGPDELL